MRRSLLATMKGAPRPAPNGASQPCAETVERLLDWRFAMTLESLGSRLSGAVIGFFLTLAPTITSLHAAENTRKTAVVSFGLFGDQGVFRREATGAAQIVANRFGGDPVVVRSNTKTGGNATAETL